MRKKLLTTTILVIAAITLVATTMLATIAYLSSSTAVSNTFTVGDVKIEMFESKVNPDGQKVDAEGEKTADGNSYHLTPGKTYLKDPSIFVNTTSDDCYIFIKARNQISHIEDGNLNVSGDDAPTMREQLIQNRWVPLYMSDNSDIIYCYKGDAGELEAGQIATYVTKPVDTRKQIDLFENFTIDSQADISRSGGAKVTITAFAIQKEGFGIEDEVGSFAYMCRLWNIVSGEFDFENVTIPESIISSGQSNVN